jgi:hypothetical protein
MTPMRYQNGYRNEAGIAQFGYGHSAVTRQSGSHNIVWRYSGR